MASCYDRTSCSVNPDNGALTINTKHGSCTVVPGNFVNLSEQDGCYTITVTDQAQVPNVQTVTICPGDQVNFTEDEDCYIITINNEPHCIPKCRYYRDCDGNILDDCARIVTCDDLAQRGFISCVDENDFDLTTECEDGSCVNCIAIKWEQICAEAETVAPEDRPDNAQFIYCSNGSLGKSNFKDSVEDIIEGCLDIDIPDVGETCGDPRYMVLAGPDSEGCVRIATYSPSGTPRAQAIFADAQPSFAPDTSFQVPADFIDPSQVYIYTDLQDAVNNDNVDNSIIVNSLLTRAQFTLDCPTRFRVQTIMDIAQPASVEDAYNQRMRVGHRYRVNGGDWVYPLTAGDLYRVGQPINALQASQTFLHGGEGGSVYPAGDIEFETFYIEEDNHARVNLNARTFRSGGNVGIPTPRTLFTPAL